MASGNPRFAAGPLTRPDCITLGPRPGSEPSPRPAVRIFLGSEPAQFRAERVFVWSIEQVRDPGRSYEIYIMRELAGFRQRGWTTGFTNYRFAIPHFAGGAGHALYNDVDQIYLRDPAQLFDEEPGQAAFRTIASDDSSVMWLDCARMADVWRLEFAQREHKKRLLERAHAIPGLHGRIDGSWNVRDNERPLAQARLLHFTGLHTQPWRPFPERFVYQEHPYAACWHTLERSADEAGFEIYTRARPSARYTGEPSLETLADMPSEDLPWVLDALFSRASDTLSARLPWDGERPSADAWQERFERAARRHPEVHWDVELVSRAGEREFRTGGRRNATAPPRVWVLADDRPGNTTQSVGLAEELAWPYEQKRLHCAWPSRLHNRLLGASLLGIDRRRSSPLAPPWPELVIAAGRRTAPVARWIRRQSQGRTKLVVLGRKGGDAAERFDLTAVPTYCRLFPHPRRLELAAPLHRITPKRLAEEGEAWRERLASAAHPRIAVLVGGTSGQYRFDVATARRLGEDVTQMAREGGGSLLATTSRRAGRAATEAFCTAIEGATLIHRWSPDADANPYLALLELADAFVITGDSESMLAEVTSLGKPVYIYPLPPRVSFRLLGLLRESVTTRARSKPAGPRGTVRPQRGIERICARWIERGWVRPTRDLDRLHAALVERGVARPFGVPFDVADPEPLCDRERVAARVRALMGVRDP